MISNKTHLFLKLSKTGEYKNLNFDSLSTMVEPLYGVKLSNLDLVNTVVSSYVEVLADPRFEIGTIHKLQKLLTAPASGFFSLQKLPTNMFSSSTFTLEQFYWSMIESIFAELQVTKTNWLEDEPNPSSLYKAGF
jgi:hypothetical protein